MFGLYDNMRHVFLKFLKVNDSNADFDEICSLLVENERVPGGDDFHKICSTFKTEETVLENMLYDCVGMSGDDVLAGLRSRKPHITL